MINLLSLCCMSLIHRLSLQEWHYSKRVTEICHQFWVQFDICNIPVAMKGVRRQCAWSLCYYRPNSRGIVLRFPTAPTAYLFSKKSNRLWGSFLAIKWAGSETDRSLWLIVEGKNMWSCNFAPCVGLYLHGVHRDNRFLCCQKTVILCKTVADHDVVCSRFDRY